MRQIMIRKIPPLETELGSLFREIDERYKGKPKPSERQILDAVYAVRQSSQKGSQDSRETLTHIRKKIRELAVTREHIVREIRSVRKERAKWAR